ncbi:hypothetical protein psyc5s11_20540 [Clostridium gelidum]|uniref:GGDEF domain-containing protein n=1 Tax=Clostridium gelidum TaxID=704125 RepID=A0ABM7TAK5_9CLOT|nr:diguanylate cyclase [Clostridium gelidum]BCZ45987.1 hypothetical protein psyc5s11_20540 [Clostridium gelidum]
MNKLYEKAKEKLSLLDNMYDVIRIIDPINKNIINISNDEITKHKEKCYDMINKGEICDNCISMRVDIEKDTFVKLEYISNKIMLIVATPINIRGEMYVVEIIKDISSQNNKIASINYNFDEKFKTIIENMNEKIITDDLTGAYNRNYIEGRLPVDINNSIINEYLLSVIMIEIHDFENVNEEYGYKIGVEILKDLSELVNQLVLQNSYWIGRYSNNKFIVVLNNIDRKESDNILADIRDLLEDISFEFDDKIIKLKVSFGIYCSKNEIVHIKNILKELEKSIYEEKQKTLDKKTNKEEKLSILNYRIQELRNVLNEMCISLDDKAEYEQTLKISQELDELIVEYMKNVI